jgi:hypothetical protein
MDRIFRISGAVDPFGKLRAGSVDLVDGMDAVDKAAGDLNHRFTRIDTDWSAGILLGWTGFAEWRIGTTSSRTDYEAYGMNIWYNAYRLS